MSAVIFSKGVAASRVSFRAQSGTLLSPNVALAVCLCHIVYQPSIRDSFILLDLEGFDL